MAREEVAEAIGVAIQMGGGPSMVYGGQALRAYDEFAAVADGQVVKAWRRSRT